MANPENAADNTYDLAVVTDEEAITSQTLAEKAIKEEKQWIIRDNFTINNGEEVEVFLGVDDACERLFRVFSRSIVPDSAVTGEVTFGREIDVEGNDLTFVNSAINGSTADEISSANVESGGNYINPDERNGEVIKLPVRSLLGNDPSGPSEPNTAGPVDSVFSVRPGGSVHYRIQSTADDNTVEFEFIIGEVEL
jgi:hypothetical protein